MAATREEAGRVLKMMMVMMLLLAASVTLFVAALSYRKRWLAIARTMTLTMLAATFYSAGYAFELLSRNLFQVKLALNVQYLGIPFLVALWLLLILQFTGVASRAQPKYALLLFIVPSIIFALHLTNEWHHLIYERFVPNAQGEFPLYTTVKGPWYQIHTVYNYALLVCCFIVFVPMYWRANPVVRKQVLLLIVGAAFPMLFNLVMWSGFKIDMTPLGFAASGVLYAWAIFRFNLLRLTPLAQAQVFETIRDGVVLLDYENQIVSRNLAAQAILPELRDQRSLPVPVEEALAAYPELLEPILAAGPSEERFAFRRSDGRIFKHYACSLAGIYDTGKAPIGKLLLLSDVTELVENEARLRENARQLMELNAFKDKLFTVVAHDIRDPIAHLVSLTELLEEETAAGEEENENEDIPNAEVFREIRGQVRGTFQLVDNLLDWYRSQRGEVAFRPMAWNLRQVVRQALALAGARANRKSIRLLERIDGNLTVNADKEMLDLIFRNLLSNAIKFTGIGGNIEVGATPEDDFVRVFVRDDGSGMDETTSRLLRQEELFFVEQGSGHEAGEARFGLMLTREFLRIHGGHLQFDSVPGEGTTFYLTLPRAIGDENGTMAGEETAVSAHEDDFS
ncbi:histidine kinase N-terminal 7TM domain-containing protein [Cohnella soli]|uniref:histidine kinase n=1 Tax=Cohnella soli TaxID=425005 RepID=A0ABW0HKC8_9BACL